MIVADSPAPPPPSPPQAELEVRLTARIAWVRPRGEDSGACEDSAAPRAAAGSKAAAGSEAAAEEEATAAEAMVEATAGEAAEEVMGEAAEEAAAGGEGVPAPWKAVLVLAWLCAHSAVLAFSVAGGRSHGRCGRFHASL
jgi:hypothetical protein